MKVITWNVNSFRKRYDHIVYLLEKEDPDILLLQEVRADHLLSIENYYDYCHSSCGSAGVGIFSKDPLEHVESYEDRIMLYKNSKDQYFMSVYVPNGFSKSASLEVKLDFFDYLFEIIKKYENYPLIVGGDWNVCYKPTEMSMESPFRISEQKKLKYLEGLLKDSTVGPHYTWFHYMYQPVVFSGSKITPGFGLDKIYCSYLWDFEPAKVLLHYRNLTAPSDHAPVSAVFYEQIL